MLNKSLYIVSVILLITVGVIFRSYIKYLNKQGHKEHYPASKETVNKDESLGAAEDRIKKKDSIVGYEAKYNTDNLKFNFRKLRGGSYLEIGRQIINYRAEVVVENLEIFITTSSVNTFKNSLLKAKKWASQNKNSKKQFDKEICRFDVMRKDEYKFFKYFISQYANECQLVFHGNLDGSSYSNFTIKKYLGPDDKEILMNEFDINNALLSLNGKSTNPDIDKIFN